MSLPAAGTRGYRGVDLERGQEAITGNLSDNSISSREKRRGETCLPR